MSNRNKGGLHGLPARERLVVWTSRHYLWSAVRETPVPEFVVDAFESVDVEHLYYSLDRVLVCLLAAPTEQITVHDVRCPCLSRQEEALILALRCASIDDEPACLAAMTAIMLPTAARVAEPAMRLLSSGLRQVPAEHLDWLSAEDDGVADLIRGKASRVRRTIN